MNKYFIILILPHNSFAQQQISNFVTPVTYFVNHIQQLNLLKNNLIKHRQASIIGTSGMGKTQLARMYSYENKNNYKLIWFIDCNLDINQELLKLAKEINSSAKSNLISEDIRLVRKEVMSYLSSQEKWLLVFDNLKISENKKVQEFVDWEHNGHVIFCSQDSEMLSNITKMTAFEKDDVITLANNILENNDPKVVKFLSKEFTGYPILIVQGAQLLNNVQGLDRAEYKREIQQSTDKIKLNIILAINELKPSAKKLLNKIALINNQGFSKELLKIITDDQSTINDDIYQLSKFALISNIDSHETNPVFEMHDVIAQKIAEINGNSNNKAYLDNIITKLVGYVPKSGIKAHIFRSAKTISENFEVILKNSEKYNLNIYKIMELNLQLMLQYYSSLNYYDVEKKVNWFNKVDQEGKFKLWLMNNDEKCAYARYIQAIGTYHRGCSNYRIAMKYSIRAKEIFGYIFIQMTRSELGIGKLEQASDHVNKAISIFLSDEFRNPKDADYSEDLDLAASYVAQGDILFAQNKIKEAVESYNKAYTIYHYLYKDNRKNVAQVSYLYSQGAKAACTAKDLHSYKFFGKLQVKEFGVEHSNTVSMFEYCKQYDMDLWAKEN